MNLSIVIPTYNERENIKELILKLQKEFKQHKISGEIIIVDDNSPDGTRMIVENLQEQKGHKNLRLIKRKGKLGLSSAVLEGWKVAKGDVLGVMDADLSHPAEKIFDLYSPIKNGRADLTIGSRYVDGGKIIGWNFKRKLMSKTATLMARLFVDVKDPMTGYFMIDRKCLDLKRLNSKGFKILMEVLIKLDVSKILEVPIIFTNRERGKSKASMKEILFYLGNILGYLKTSKSLRYEFLKFATVGFVGTILNLTILFLLTEFLGIWYIFSAIITFVFVMTFNFVLNKLWTFKKSLGLKKKKKYLKFAVVSVFAALINLLLLYSFTEFLGFYYMISQLIAIGITLFINFLGNKLWTFSC